MWKNKHLNGSNGNLQFREERENLISTRLLIHHVRFSPGMLHRLGDWAYRLSPGKTPESLIQDLNTTKDSIFRSASNLSLSPYGFKTPKAFCKIFRSRFMPWISWVSWCETWLDLAGSLADSLEVWLVHSQPRMTRATLSRIPKCFTMTYSVSWRSGKATDLRFVSQHCQLRTYEGDLAKWSFSWNHKRDYKDQRHRQAELRQFALTFGSVLFHQKISFILLIEKHPSYGFAFKFENFD